MKYTREILAAAVARSTSLNDVLRHLNVDVVGGYHTHISRQLKKHDIDTSHFIHEKNERRRAQFTRESLAAAAPHCETVREVMDYIGVQPYDSAYSHIRHKMRKFEIDTSHFKRPYTRSSTEKNREPKKDDLTRAVAMSRSFAETIRNIDLPVTTTSRRMVRSKIAYYGIDTSHFTGQAHNRGRTSSKRAAPSDVLTTRPETSSRVNPTRLRRALAENGRPYHCVKCEIDGTWQGQKITLHVDHIDGNWRNCRPENLRFLCPNCHSQTETFCRKKSSTP